MLFTESVQTHRRNEYLDITPLINKAIEKSRVKEGIVVIFCPHTTAAITINENADPDVLGDLSQTLSELIPEQGNYDHAEGNSDAHLKSTLTGVSETVIIEKGRLLLGTWQSIYFCEHDGPRNRTLHIKILGTP